MFAALRTPMLRTAAARPALAVRAAVPQARLYHDKVRPLHSSEGASSHHSSLTHSRHPPLLLQVIDHYERPRNVSTPSTASVGRANEAHSASPDKWRTGSSPHHLSPRACGAPHSHCLCSLPTVEDGATALRAPERKHDALTPLGGPLPLIASRTHRSARSTRTTSTSAVASSVPPPAVMVRVAFFNASSPREETTDPPESRPLSSLPSSLCPTSPPHLISPRERKRTVMKLMIKVDDKGIISDVKFKTFGCGSAIASSSYMTERVRGLSLDEAAAIKNTEIAQEVRRRACSRESRLAEEVTDPANPPFVSPYTSHDLLPPTCYLFLYLFLDNKSALLATRQAALLHARVRPPPVAPRTSFPSC